MMKQKKDYLDKDDIFDFYKEINNNELLSFYLIEIVNNLKFDSIKDQTLNKSSSTFVFESIHTKI